jgi:hypothetical protein
LERLTINLPDHLAKRVRRISKQTGLKISRIVAQAMEERMHEEETPSQAPFHPSVSWKLKGPKITDRAFAKINKEPCRIVADH